MTRKDYVLIAAALKEARSHWLTLPADITADQEAATRAAFALAIKAAAEELAGSLRRENPRFDRARFFKAAGVQS